MNAYTKDELVKLATTHADIEVRKAAAEAIYTNGKLHGGEEMIAVFGRGTALANRTTQVPG